VDADSEENCRIQQVVISCLATGLLSELSASSDFVRFCVLSYSTCIAEASPRSQVLAKTVWCVVYNGIH
jgi:hypothetical protein